MRTAFRLGIRVLCCVCSGAIISAASAPPPKVEAPNSDFRAIIGGTIQYAHNDIWTYTPAATGPLVPTAEEVVRGQRLDVVLSFGGFAVDGTSQGDVVYDLAVNRPDGTTRVVGTNLPAFHGTAPDSHVMHVAAKSVYLAFGKDDPAGTYRFSAKLKDRIGHAELEVSSTITLLDSDADKPLPADFDLRKILGDWLMHYYEHPDPRMALPVLRFISHDPKIANDRNHWSSILGAYEMILRDNPWLVARFRARIMADHTDDSERTTLLYVLAYVFRANPAFGEFLPPAVRGSFSRSQNQSWPDPAQEILSGKQLDLLWGRFLATGEFAPIERLVSVLDYQKFRGSLDAFSKLDPKPASAPIEAYKEMVYQAATWSLKSNATQLRLVKDYLTYLINDPKTAPVNALQIALICGYRVEADGKIFDPKRSATGSPH